MFEEVYLRLKTHLESGKIASLLELEEEEKKAISDLHLLTAKPFIYAVNVAEDRVNTPENELRKVTGITDEKIPVLPVSAKIEMDMLEFSDEEKKELQQLVKSQ